MKLLAILALSATLAVAQAPKTSTEADQQVITKTARMTQLESQLRSDPDFVEWYALQTQGGGLDQARHTAKSLHDSEEQAKRQAIQKAKADAAAKAKGKPTP